MKLQEALVLLLQGKSIRRTVWSDPHRLRLSWKDSGGAVVPLITLITGDIMNDVPFDEAVRQLVDANDWEVYQPKPQPPKPPAAPSQKTDRHALRVALLPDSHTSDDETLVRLRELILLLRADMARRVKNRKFLTLRRLLDVMLAVMQ